jgi:hypothetical protein
MSKFIRLAACILCLGVLALAALSHKLLPKRNASQQTLVELFASKEQIDKLEEEHNHYLESKRRVAKEVIAGRRSLAEAIEEFRKLDEPWLSARDQERILKVLRMSEVEWRGRKVIFEARRVLADHPDEAAAVADRLEKELQHLLAGRKRLRAEPADPRSGATQEQHNGHSLRFSCSCGKVKGR